MSKAVCDIDSNSAEWAELDKLAKAAGYHSAKVAADEGGYWMVDAAEFKDFLTNQALPE